MCTQALAYQLTVDYLHYVCRMQKQLGLRFPRNRHSRYNFNDA